MPDLFDELTEDAQRIAEGLMQQAQGLRPEYDQLKQRLAQIEAINEAAAAVPQRQTQLEQIYASRTDPLCPRCYLERRVNRALVPVAGGTADSDRYSCPACGHEAIVEV